jgi:hypothetical protein
MKHLPRTQETVNRQLRDRVRNLERASGGNQRPTEEELAVFSHAGDVTATVSPPYFVRKGGQIVALTIAVGTQASGSSTFKVAVNGTQVGSTVTFPASTSTAALHIGDVRVANGSRLTLEAATVGAGLADLGATIVMKG